MDNRSRIGSSSQVIVKEEERSFIFQVPSHLVEMYGGVMPSKVTLTTDESKKMWKLSIEKFHGEYFFTDGWKEFAEGVGLDFRRFLMYKPGEDDSSEDDSFNQKAKKNNGRRKISGNALGTTTSSLNKNKKSSDAKKRFWFFSKEMKKYHQYRLDIPGSFVRSTGIRAKDIIILKVKDTEGMEWPVNVTKRAAVFSLCGGWIEFVTDNKVTVGSRLYFRWLSKRTIQVQIQEAETKQLLINATSRRGKQLELLDLSDSDVSNEDENDTSKEKCAGVGKKWRFERVLKKENAHSMDFPLNFSMVVGERTSGNIELMDCERRMWPVKYNRRTSFRLTTGWIDFLVANEASVGSTVVFKSLPNCNTVLAARVEEGRTRHKVLFVKKPRGRPRSESLEKEQFHASPSCP